MQCDEIKKLLEKYVDNELEPALRKRVESHISGCPDCKRELTALLGINALGDLEYLPDPGTGYWRTLTRNISEKISRSDRRSASEKTRLIKIFWPAAPGIRFAGVAVSAVLVFFLVKTTFFRDGRIDPGNLDIRSLPKAEYSLESNEPAMKKTAADQDGIGDFTGEAPEVKPLPSALKEIKGKAVSELEAREEEVQTAKTLRREFNHGRLADRADDKKFMETSDTETIVIEGTKLSDEMPLRSVKPASVTGVRFTGTDTIPVTASKIYAGVPISGANPPPVSGVKFAGAEGSSKLTIGAIQPVNLDNDSIRTNENNENVLDIKDLSSYFSSETQIQKSNNPIDKIALWGKFINTGPDSILIRIAKFRQAALYYTIACSLKTEDHIEAALKFYETSKPVFKDSSRLKTIESYRLKTLQLNEKGNDEK